MNPASPPAVPDYAAHAQLKPTRLLTSEQVVFFQQHGYLAVANVMPLEEIPEVRRIYDRLFNEDRSKTEGDLYNLAGAKEKGKKEDIAQILQPGKYAPALLETQLVANLKAMMQQLLGPETHMVGDHAINKPPHNTKATPWHQDEAYWNPAKEYRGLSIWVPLQPATKLNGCMYFVPGSHNFEVIPHQPIGDNPLTPGLEVVPGSFDFGAAVACELPAGGATFHLERTLHYTPMNQSDDYRRAYIAVGTQFERPRATARKFPWQERQAAARAASKVT